jgi:hypothetical protein
MKFNIKIDIEFSTNKSIFLLYPTIFEKLFLVAEQRHICKNK